MKKLFVIAAMIAAFGLRAAAFAATADKPPSPPGQGECEHGNNLKGRTIRSPNTARNARSMATRVA